MESSVKGDLLHHIPLSDLSGVSGNHLAKLSRINLYNVQDLLLHLPLRYEDRTHLYSIESLEHGLFGAVQGRIVQAKMSSVRRRILTCQIEDGTGALILRFFHFNKGIQNALSVGKDVMVYGEVKEGYYGLEMIHPKFKIQGKNNETLLSTVLTPIYSTTEGLSQSTLNKLVGQALALLEATPIAEILPSQLMTSLISLPEAIKTLHRPPKNISLEKLTQWRHPACIRLIFEELMAYHLSLLTARENAKHHRALPFSKKEALKKSFLSSLTFKMTSAQQRVVSEIERDLARSTPMMRLIQGDVGSGKTLVAALAALQVIAHGKQVALMAPTEILAEQHLTQFQQWFTPLGLSAGCLLGKQKGKLRQAQQNAIASGKILMVIGTQAIFQAHVKFSALALVIIDEQHRFGVHQRLALWSKAEKQGFHPHQLIMTATPIPRTLTMSAYANLDTSIIDELPSDRIPIHTVVIPDTRRIEIIDRIKEICLSEGRQAYWVCTLIDESELLEAQAAEVTYEELKKALPDIQMGLLHGRVKESEKDIIMQAFHRGEIQLLVATTVIEVGINVPNASLMIIENPERLGLAQLHQLRGRIGRGSIASYCVLLYKTPLSQVAQQRLQIMRETHDGFVIAQKDLEIRGPGQLLGTRQTGSLKFKVADIVRDQDLLSQICEWALFLHKEYPKQAKVLMARWLPEGEHYRHA
ncbi:ATP-dependent DNA helicase RecG [Candidatus Williamhamiltonella defendens]|nr:ATP-dependent DNA helicase RecG [Candidatus Hamiltonella defensa]